MKTLLMLIVALTVLSTVSHAKTIRCMEQHTGWGTDLKCTER